METKRRRRSELWNYFESVEDGMAMCILCKKKQSFKTSTSNLSKHLARKHPTVCENIQQREETSTATQLLLQTQSNVSFDEEMPITSYVEPIHSTEPESALISNQATIATYTPLIVRVNKRSKKSGLWNHFEPLEDKMALCNICKIKLSFKSTTYNLNKHLTRKHPTVTIGNGTEDMPFILSDNCSDFHSQTHTALCVEETPISSNMQLVPHTGQSLSSVSDEQTAVATFIPNKISINNKTKLDGLLMRLFIHDYQPFSIVEDKGFSELVKALNPTYKLPDRKYLSTSLLPAMYEKCAQEVREKIILQSKSICLTTECWTSVVGEIYMAITAHYIDSELTLCSVLLDCIPISGVQSSEDLAYHLKLCVDEWGITSKILLVVSNNVTNIKSAVMEKLHWKHFTCYAHTLNLVVQDALAENNVKIVLRKVKDIVSYFKRNSMASKKLLRFQTQSGEPAPKRLIPEKSIWWNSVFFMLCRITELREHVESSLAHLDYEGSVLTVDEWEICEQMCRVLRPFEEATRQMSSEKYMTASEVLPLTNGLLYVTNKLKEKQYCATVKIFVENLNKGIEERFPNLEGDMTITVSTLLDPRYKLHVFKDSSSAAHTVKNDVIDLVTSIIKESNNVPEIIETVSVGSDKSGEEMVSLWDEFDSIVCKAQPKGTAKSKAVIEVQRYLDDEILLRNENPLTWWRKYKEIYPHLAELVRLKSCVLATSVPCERIFSIAESMFSDRRARLGARKVKQLMFLNANLPKNFLNMSFKTFEAMKRVAKIKEKREANFIHQRLKKGKVLAKEKDLKEVQNDLSLIKSAAATSQENLYQSETNVELVENEEDHRIMEEN